MSSPTQDLFHRLPPRARVLFIRLRSMGDCLLLTSPLRALKQEFGSFRIAVLVEPRFVPCFEGNPDIAEVLVAGPTKYRTLRGLLRQRFDAIVNLHGGGTSLVYARAARGKRYGLEDYPGRFLYSGLIPRGPADGHTVEGVLDWFRWLGLRAEAPPSLYYGPQPAARAWVAGKIGRRPYVVIHPGALMETKRWSTERFRTLGRLLNEKGWKVIVTAGPGEGDLARRAAGDLDDSLVLLGLTMPRLAELIRGADLYIGNDSGPMHLAAAVGTPTVAVWGSSNSKRWHPWQVPHRVVQNPFECNPCPGYRCLVADTPLCIESVSVDQVGEAVASLAAETGRNASVPAASGDVAR